MGDSLTFAQEFCTHSRQDIDAVISGVCAQPCADADVLLTSLSSIQSGAKQVHARAIYRAAQTVIDSVLSSAPTPAIQGRVLSLNKLMTQFETGLNEVLPAPANAAEDTALPELSISELIASDLTESDFSISDNMTSDELVYCETPPPMPTAEQTQLQARFAQVRETLMPLMGLAREDEQSSLLTITNLLPAEISPSQLSGEFSDQPADQSSETQKTVSSKAAPAKALAPKVDKSPLIDFETLMPTFTSDALQAARQVEKTVSVSYASGGITLSKTQAEALQPVLSHIAQTLVTGVLERPEVRRARGDSGAGHIALTASQTSRALSISIECPGAPLSASAFLPDAHAVNGLSLTPGANMHDGGSSHIVLTLAPRAGAQPIAAAFKEIAS